MRASSALWLIRRRLPRLWFRIPALGTPGQISMFVRLSLFLLSIIFETPSLTYCMVSSIRSVDLPIY